VHTNLPGILFVIFIKDQVWGDRRAYFRGVKILANFFQEAVEILLEIFELVPNVNFFRVYARFKGVFDFEVQIAPSEQGEHLSHNNLHHKRYLPLRVRVDAIELLEEVYRHAGAPAEDYFIKEGLVFLVRFGNEVVEHLEMSKRVPVVCEVVVVL
jgi:hypothetical protein